MRFIALAATLATFLFSAQVAAAPVTYSFEGTLESHENWSNLTRVYAGGTAVSGTFRIDTAAGSFTEPGITNRYGSLSGSARVGANTIQFGNSYSYTHNFYPGYTIVTMLGGNAWNTGGWISESLPPQGFNIEGLQIQLVFEGDKPTTTALADLFAGSTLLNSSIYLGYGYRDNMFYANWGDLTGATPVPEPSMLFLIGLGMFGLFATYKRPRKSLGR